MCILHRSFDISWDLSSARSSQWLLPVQSSGFSISIPPESSPSRHDVIGAFALLMLMMFFAGGFVGARGLTADFVSDILRPAFCWYAIIIFLCALPGWSLGEAAGTIGLATAGIFSTVVCTLLLTRYITFRPEQEDNQDSGNSEAILRDREPRV
jgi:hypothetical protein